MPTPTIKVKHVVLFGCKDQTEYYTSKALDFRGYPAQLRATKVGVFQLLRNWEYLKFAVTHKVLFKPLRSIAISFPFESPPQGFMDSLVGVLWRVVEVEVPRGNQ